MLRDDSGNDGGRASAPLNVLGDRLDVCSMTPKTGFLRDGCCTDLARSRLDADDVRTRVSHWRRIARARPRAKANAARFEPPRSCTYTGRPKKATRPRRRGGARTKK